MPANRFQQVDRTQDVDFEVLPGILHGGGHGHLAGQMENRAHSAAFEHRGQRERIARISVNEFEFAQRAEPFQVGERPHAGQIVEDNHLFRLTDQMGRKVASHEATAARD